MSSRIFEAALHNRLMTIMLVIVFVAIGMRAMLMLPIDASPDVTPNVVQIVTDASGLGAVEVEKLITFPVEGRDARFAWYQGDPFNLAFRPLLVSVYFDEKSRYLLRAPPGDGTAAASRDR